MTIISLHGNVDDYEVTDLEDGTVSVDVNGATTTAHTNDRLSFDNGYITLSPSDPAWQVYRLYHATLGRGSDQSGLDFWVHQLNSGVTLTSAASGFVNSQEFRTTFGNNVSAQTLVTELYQNVLNREPDSSGLDYWVGRLDSGMSRESLVTGFTESAEGVNLIGVSAAISGHHSLTVHL